jgi:signal transduction histidine kinase
MIYLHYWSSFWKSWAEIAKPQDESHPSRPAIATKSAQTASFSPKEKYEYLTEYGTQILSLLHAGVGCGYLSANFETLTGNAAEDYLGDAFFDIVNADFHERLGELLATPTSRNQPHVFRCKLKHGDGKYYWYVMHIHSKPKGENVCIMENVHDSILIQNTLQKAKLEAELALRARSEFLANMSHDLRTPLNAVIGFAQIMEKQIFGAIDNPQYLEYAKHIQESGYDLLGKIEDLLEIANIDAGRTTLEREEAYLSEIIKHVTEAQTHHANGAKITLEYQPLDGDAQLFVDRLKLQHILGHLVGNAIKFSQPEGKVQIVASISDRNELELRIRDHGVGMSKSKLAGILETLSEDHCWTGKNNQHIGLGLALTKEFVGLHNGTIAISSKSGNGTSVHITLPPDCIRSHNAVREHEYVQAAS